MAMNEYVYKLNLPNIDKVLKSLEEVEQLVSTNFTGSKIFYPDPANIFNSEWLNYKGLEWDYVSLFIRSGRQTSIIHRDDPLSSNALHWGINWIWSEESVMEYWTDHESFQRAVIVDSGGAPTLKMSTDKKADREYKMITGVYLINASVPHRVRNLSDEKRIAISLRSKKFRYQNPSATWQQIIDIFQSEIG